MSEINIDIEEDSKEEGEIIQQNLVYDIRSIQCLIYGTTINKLYNQGRFSHPVTFYINESDPNYLQWISEKKNLSQCRIDIRSITDIKERQENIKGQSQQQKNTILIVYYEQSKELQLLFDNDSTKQKWKEGLIYFTNQAKESLAITHEKLQQKGLYQYIEKKAEAFLLKKPKNQNKQLNPSEIFSILQDLDLGSQAHVVAENIEKVIYTDRSCMTIEQFKNILHTSLTRENLRPAYNKYCIESRISKKQHDSLPLMNIEEIRNFFRKEQQEDLDMNQLLEIIHKNKIGPEIVKQEQQISFLDFCQIISTFENLMYHRNAFQMNDDISLPINNYFIKTCYHRSIKTLIDLKKCLLNGVRFLNIFIKDIEQELIVSFDNNEAILPFRQVIEFIQLNAFEISPFPLLLNLNIQCSLEQQEEVAKVFQQVLQNNIQSTLIANNKNPLQLRNKIILISSLYSEQVKENNQHQYIEELSKEHIETSKQKSLEEINLPQIKIKHHNNNDIVDSQHQQNQSSSSNVFQSDLLEEDAQQTKTQNVNKFLKSHKNSISYIKANNTSNFQNSKKLVFKTEAINSDQVSNKDKAYLLVPLIHYKNLSVNSSMIYQQNEEEQKDHSITYSQDYYNNLQSYFIMQQKTTNDKASSFNNNDINIFNSFNIDNSLSVVNFNSKNKVNESQSGYKQANNIQLQKSPASGKLCISNEKKGPSNLQKKVQASPSNDKNIVNTPNSEQKKRQSIFFQKLHPNLENLILFKRENFKEYNEKNRIKRELYIVDYAQYLQFTQKDFHILQNIQKNSLVALYIKQNEEDYDEFNPFEAYSKGFNIVLNENQYSQQQILVLDGQFLQNGGISCGYVLKSSQRFISYRKLPSFNEIIKNMTIQANIHILSIQCYKIGQIFVKFYHYNEFSQGILLKQVVRRRKISKFISGEILIDEKIQLNIKKKDFEVLYIEIECKIANDTLIRDEQMNDKKLMCTLPMKLLRPGYRVIPLLNVDFTFCENVNLLYYIQFDKQKQT